MAADARQRDDEPAPARRDAARAADAIVTSLVERGVPDLIALYRFGSSLRGRLRPDSDLDHAVLAAHRLNAIPANPCTAPYEDLRLKALGGARR